ncbi:MAG: hypothetical protein QM647_18790 [Asticcacaulis sp.]|uniref:hypothetical protein n=1 Tax=Asticcacaulis sp. TaxID=1872648 RepID=UPI0039E41A5D
MIHFDRRAVLRAITSVSVLALMSGASLATAADIPFAKGQAWTVTQTTELNNLTIPAGGSISAPDGKSVTLTVDGVERPIAAGAYNGHVVITVTDPITIKYKDLEPHQFRTAVYINNGRYDATRSVSAARLSGTVNDTEASDVNIDSQNERFNGFVVTGDSKYTIDNPVIDLTGNGGNDFAGFGAGITAIGNADLTVNNPKIRTKGAIRTAIFVGGNAVVHVNNADILVENGKLPSDYQFTVQVGKMMEVPWMLGLSGNVRATNLVDHGTVYYTNSHIVSQGWGAMSTDDSAVVRMYVKDSLIETLDSGYGAYSIGDSIDTFDHSTLNVADIGVIMAAQGSATLTNGTILNSKRYGVMMHSGGGGGKLIIDKGSVVNSRLTAIEAKGLGTTILIDDAKINAGNGILLQAMENDDPFMKKMMAGGGMGGPGGPGAPGGPVVGVQDGPPGGMKMPEGSPDVALTLRNTAIEGDVINTRTKQGGLTVTLDHASLFGGVSTGIQAPLGGVEPDEHTYWQIGNVTTSWGATSEKNGAGVSVGESSVWTVTKTSYLTSLDIGKTGRIDAPQGYRVNLTIDGKPAALKAGSYKGALVLSVSPGK